MQRRNSRKESDINGVFNVRYCGGAKMLLVLELGGRLSGLEVPVMVRSARAACSVSYTKCVCSNMHVLKSGDRVLRLRLSVAEAAHLQWCSITAWPFLV